MKIVQTRGISDERFYQERVHNIVNPQNSHYFVTLKNEKISIITVNSFSTEVFL